MRILVCDDDRFSRERVAGLLRGSGFEVETAESGKHAIDRITVAPVDLLLLDLMMPGLSGIDVVRLAKSLAGGTFVPVILLTAKGDVESRVEGLRMGADDYLAKPFDDRELLARVSAMLRIKKMHDGLLEQRARLEQLAAHDELTGLANFRTLQGRLFEEFKRAERYRDPLACVMIDIDRFKDVNDRHGHSTGDTVLAEVAKRLREGLRDIDVVGRYGGEEFLLVLPSTHFAGALTVADRLWQSVRASPVPHAGGSVPVTISLGIALYPSRDIKSKEQLLEAADKALYQAKSDGRDCICVFQHRGYIYRPEARPSDAR